MDSFDASNETEFPVYRTYTPPPIDEFAPVSMLDNTGHRITNNGRPLMNHKDKRPDINIPRFTKCETPSGKSLEIADYSSGEGWQAGDGNCPMEIPIDAYWQEVKSDVVVTNGKTLIFPSSFLICQKGGVIGFLDSGQVDGAVNNYSEDLVQFVKQEEGLSLTPYNNGQTISYGFDYTKYPGIDIVFDEDGSISEQEADRLLRIILDQSKNQINTYLEENNLELDRGAYDSAADLLYNRNSNDLTKEVILAMANSNDQKVEELFSDFDYRYALKFLYNGNEASAGICG